VCVCAAQRLSSEVSGIPGVRTLTNEDLRLVHAQLRAAAHASNERAKEREQREQREQCEQLEQQRDERERAQRDERAARGESAERDAAAGSAADDGSASARSGGKKVVRTGKAAVGGEKASDNTTLHEALETLSWFGFVIGEKKKPSSSARARPGVHRSAAAAGGGMSTVSSFVDLEHLSACFDESGAASGSLDSTLWSDDGVGLDDQSLATWDWVAAADEAGLADEEDDDDDDEYDDVVVPPHHTRDVIRHPSEARGVSEARFESEEGSEHAARSGDCTPRSGSPSSGSPSECGRASPPTPAVGGGERHSSASSCEQDTEAPSPYVSPPRNSKAEWRAQQQRTGLRQPTLEVDEIDGPAPPMSVDDTATVDRPAAAGEPASQATRRSRREAKPKTFLLDEQERPLLKWEKELQQQKEGKKKAAAPPPPPTRLPALPPVPLALKRRMSQDSSSGREALYETDGESPLSPLSPPLFGLSSQQYTPAPHVPLHDELLLPDELLAFAPGPFASKRPRVR
jgi:hypothetical protein